MSLVEKALFAIILIGGLAFSITSLLDSDWLFATVIQIHGGLIALLIYYLIRVKLSYISLIILAWILSVIGYLFTIVHWLGATTLATIGIIGSGLFAITLVWSTARAQEHRKGQNLYYFVGAVIFIQSVLYLVGPDGELMGRTGELMNYILVGLISTIKLRDIEFSYGIDKVLNVYFLTGLTFILWDTTRLMN